MTVVAKFEVQTVTHHKGDMAVITLRPAVGAGNESWSKWIPTGELTMTITNPEASKYFKPGASYLLTFEEEKA